METINLSKDIKDRREQFDEMGKIYYSANHVKIEPEQIADVRCYWFIPQNPMTDKTIIYLHGGGYIMGSIESHDAMVSHLADRFNASILFVEYALAPENPYPAGVNDFLKVYRQLLQQNSSLKLFVIGDSAGGGILLSALAKMNDLNLPQPAGIIVISPWFDLECTADSYELNESIDPIFTKAMIQQYASLYVGNGNLSEANPIRCKLQNYPPALILVGTNELLIDDSTNFFHEIKKYQPKSKLSIYENQSHVWLLPDISTDASQKAINEMKGFLDSL
ncbi:MAG: alpha/beta hydrolase [Lentimicrobiaceae bacterium]|jgi:acetyl esterase/lipase